MMRALFAGVSGLRNHQVRLDVIGNNIANVNTLAFKSSRVTFEEAFAQLVQGATRPIGNAGGINPTQVGLGMNIGSIDTDMSQGNLEATGQKTDLAIQGSAFFVLSNGTQRFYTRAGNFQLDANGRLVAPTNGFVVQGINADATGTISPTAPITDIQLPFGQKSPARATTTVGLTGNLDASTAPGGVHSAGITVYDAMGNAHNLTIVFTKDLVNPNQWNWTATPAAPATVISGGSGVATFDGAGALASFTYAAPATSFQFDPANGATSPVDITFDPGQIGAVNGLSQFGAPSTAVAANQDGYTMGDLQDISIDSTGSITGFFSNGVSQTLAQISLSNFNNPGGLIRRGDNMYQESGNSGQAVLGFAGASQTSSITPGALESSNVDLSQEFTSMIITQRGFQANARVITTADEMLNELVNLKR